MDGSLENHKHIFCINPLTAPHCGICGRVGKSFLETIKTYHLRQRALKRFEDVRPFALSLQSYGLSEDSPIQEINKMCSLLEEAERERMSNLGVIPDPASGIVTLDPTWYPAIHPENKAIEEASQVAFKTQTITGKWDKDPATGRDPLDHIQGVKAIPSGGPNAVDCFLVNGVPVTREHMRKLMASDPNCYPDPTPSQSVLDPDFWKVDLTVRPEDGH